MTFAIFNTTVTINIQNFQSGKRSVFVKVNGKIGGMKVAAEISVMEGAQMPVSVSLQVTEEDSHASKST